ncbi:MAG: hypothetical protein IAF58_07315 [Leptolyngbya sp.]|nr:hypothetical protein [Candidatus Melainabacteria bacterium]
MVDQAEHEVEQEQNFLAAVHALGALQREQLEAIQKLDSLGKAESYACEQLRLAEYQVAKSEVTVSQKHAVRLDADQFFRDLEPEGIGVLTELSSARRHLWSVATGDDDEILQAAQRYGRAAKAWQTYSPKHHAAVDAVKVAMEDWKRAKREHAVLVERQEASRQQLRSATQELNKVSEKAYMRIAIFDLEKNVVDLANAFTGIEELKITYDCVDTKDLKINFTAK